MPIVLTPIGKPLELPCPHCGAALLRVEPKASHTPPGEYWCLDGDTVPIFSRLTEAQRDMAFTTELALGRQSCCQKDYYVVQATFFAGAIDPDFEDVYFHRNGDRGEETNFTAEHDGRKWFVTRFESDRGPVLEHTFGPFASPNSQWIGPHGVSMCRPGDDPQSPWNVAPDLLLSLWDELQALQRRIDPDPFVLPRAEPLPRLETSPVPELDDDIPF